MLESKDNTRNKRIFNNVSKNKLLKIFFLIIMFFVLPNFAFAALENLDETLLRKNRLGNVNWGPALLENISNNYTWQPETLNYSDATTNSEVWKITSTPASMGGENQDVADTHWSANGNRLMFHSARSNQAYPLGGYVNSNGVSYIAIRGGTATEDNQPPNVTFWKVIPYDASYPAWHLGTYYDIPSKAWMLSNADGSRLKPAYGAASQTAETDPYVLWSPILADVLYQGSNNQYVDPLNALYKINVSDSTITKSSFLTLPSSVTRISLKKAIPGDGSAITLKDVYNGIIFPLTVYPESNKALLSANGYESQFNFDYYWGITPSPWAEYHETRLTGAKNGVDGIWYYLMPESAGASFWRSRIMGLGVNGQPTHIPDQDASNGYYDWDHTSPNWNGSTIEPVNTVCYGSSNDPWLKLGLSAIDHQYPGHVSTDRWGHYLIYEHTQNGGPYVQAFFDARNHSYSGRFYGIQNGSHTDWEAWSDWALTDGNESFNIDFNGVAGKKALYTINYLSGVTKEIANCHSNYNAGLTTEASFLGPIQSPDGTKIQYVSSFMNTQDSNHQLFWATAYYPYPPEIKSVNKNGNNIRLTWDFNQGTSCASQSTVVDRTGPTPNFINPRTYATRGWPHETLDCPPSPREIDKFRILTSTDNSTWSSLGTTTYNNCRGDNECGMWTESFWSFDATQPNNTTRYYAITSLEYSGLESRALSNVWKVITDGSGNITQQLQQANYPIDPGGKSGFLMTHPDAPIGINSVHDSAMQYTLTWNAPANKTLIRYYNIYAKDGSSPTAVQQNRIASIPATSDYANSGNFSYIDWAGNSDGSTQYLVAAVDYQGNESGSGETDSTPPAAPTNLSVQ